jgi:hypothetical protein
MLPFSGDGGPDVQRDAYGLECDQSKFSTAVLPLTQIAHQCQPAMLAPQDAV